MYIDNERLNRLKKSLDTIIAKVILTLEKYGYQKEDILKDTLNWTNQLNKLTLVDSLEDLSTRLELDYKKIKKKP